MILNFCELISKKWGLTKHLVTTFLIRHFKKPFLEMLKIRKYVFSNTGSPLGQGKPPIRISTCNQLSEFCDKGVVSCAIKSNKCLNNLAGSCGAIAARVHLFWNQQWQNQDVIYNFKAQLYGTGSRSKSMCE